MNKQIINIQTEVARKKLIEKAEQKNELEKNLFQGLLYVGNRHETVPLRLLTDQYLTPRAKTAWQLIKLNAYQFQGSVFPSYEELSLWLSDRAFQGKTVSRKVVSQTLLILRLTRWLTLCETVRNAHGQVLGNVYIMNDEPLSLTDAIQLNSDYLRIVEKAALHKDPLVRDIASAIITRILEHKDQLWHFISHIGVIKERYKHHKDSVVIEKTATELPENIAIAVQETQEKLLSSDMELSKYNRELGEKSVNPLSSNMELSHQNEANPLILGLVPYRNPVEVHSTSTKSTNIKYSTSTRDDSHLNDLDGFQLSALEKNSILSALQPLDDDTRKAILFEAKERISKGDIKKPAAYLFKIVQRAIAGEFKPYLINKAQQVENTQHYNKYPSRATKYLPNIVHTPSETERNQSLEIIRHLSQSMKSS